MHNDISDVIALKDGYFIVGCSYTGEHDEYFEWAMFVDRCISVCLHRFDSNDNYHLDPDYDHPVIINGVVIPDIQKHRTSWMLNIKTVEDFYVSLPHVNYRDFLAVIKEWDVLTNTGLEWERNKTSLTTIFPK